MKQIPGFPNYCVTKDGRVWSKKQNGTSPFGFGEQNHAAKLTEAQVRFIFAAYHNKTYRPGELARRFEINVDHVSRIARKERWGHLWND